MTEIEGVAKFLQAEDATLHFFQKSTDCTASLLLPVGDPRVLKDVELGTVGALLVAAIYCLIAFIRTFRRLKTQRIVYKEE